MNCWEFVNCGREPGGDRADDLGVCPAAADRRFDGLNDGINAGRVCWIVAGTENNDRPHCILADRHHPCQECSFYQQVQQSAGTPAREEISARQDIPLCAELFGAAT